jgi:hypothetical protein
MSPGGIAAAASTCSIHAPRCRKTHPTFSDTLAAVRRQVWAEQGLITSRHPVETAKLRPALREGIAYALCHAA